MALRLTSKAFDAFGEIPRRYTAEGDNLSPPMQWSNVPQGTREFVLICEDPDAPTPKPFLHWLIYHLSANTSQLPEGLPYVERTEYPVLARQGKNTLQKIGYTGPKPPIWHSAHHYIFRLFALNSELSVPEGAGRDEVLRAMKGHVLEEAKLVGYYERSARRTGSWRLASSAEFWLTAGIGLGACFLVIAMQKRKEANEIRRAA